MRFCRIFDEVEAPLARNLQQPQHLGGMTIGVHRNYCLGSRRNRSFDQIDVDVQIFWLRVDEPDGRAGIRAIGPAANNIISP